MTLSFVCQVNEGDPGNATTETPATIEHQHEQTRYQQQQILLQHAHYVCQQCGKRDAHLQDNKKAFTLLVTDYFSVSRC